MTGGRGRALAALALLTAVAGAAARVPPAAAQPAATAALPAPVAPSKKEALLAAKARPAAAPAATPPRKVGAPPPPVVSLYNTWTHEWLALDADARAELPPPETVARFLRCHFTNQPTDMDGALAKTLRAAARHFKKDRIDVVSGFRAPKYNLMLRKKGRQVARDSQHTQGNAVDFRIPGVDVKTLEAWARRLRLGGVGVYQGSGFIHIDTGRVRYWSGT